MKTLFYYPDAQIRPLVTRRVFGFLRILVLALFSTVGLKAQVTITCPPTVNISCSTNPIPTNTGTATATTLCGVSSAVNVTYQDNNNQMTGCMGTGTKLRTWTATDACGFSATCVQTIVIEDNTSPTLTCPPFMVVSCETDISPQNLGMAEASDNCTPTGMILITYTDNAQNLNQCNGSGTLTRNWQAEDQCGNIAVCIQTIVIVDNTIPVLTIPAPVTVSCNGSTDPSITGNATATDNCTASSEMTVLFSDNVIGLTGCNGTGTIIRTWSVQDACNNIASGVQMISVIDNTPPVITCPAPITISCESSVLPAVTGTVTASDACGSVFTGFTDQSFLSCNGTGFIQRQWNVTDVCGNLSTCVQLITIIDTQAPVVTCPVDITVDCAVGTLPAVTGNPQISDNCTPSANLEVEYTDTEIEPIGCNGTGLLQRTWNITDACGNLTSCNQMIRITDLLKPTLTCPQPITISCESSVSPEVTGVATASDNCTPEVDLDITYNDDVSGTFGCNGTGLLRRTWMATDLCGNTSTCVQFISITDDIDPVIVCPANITISCSDPSLPSNTGEATATDNCSSNVEVTYSDAAQLNSCNNTGLILRTWSARDLCGNVKTCMQMITVVDNTAPVVVCPRDTIIDCGIYINPDVLGYPSGTDNCTPSEDLVLGYSDDLSGLTGCTNTGLILRTWTMRDACGNIGSCVQRITVADTTEPVIVCPANVVISCEDQTTPNVLGKATATDYCTASLFIQITYQDDLSQAGQCNGSGFIYRVWTATDQCGNAATCTQTIEIKDTESPEIQCPASYAISCEADRSPDTQGYARATDNCTADEDIIITYSDDVSGLTGCNHTGNLYRTWLATDACGNQATCVQVLTIQDLKKPVVTPPAAITVSCESGTDVSVTGNITKSDNCTPEEALEVSVSDDLTSLNGCNGTGTIKRTWVVTDNCGNSASVSQQIRVVDTTIPQITCGDPLSVACGSSVDPSLLGYPTYSDNCTPVDQMDVLHFDNTLGLNGCNGTGTIFRTWVVYDDCGNVNSCVQTINVVDEVGPTLTLPSDLTISCEYADDLDELGRATATDGCTPDASIAITFIDNDLGLVHCNSTGKRLRTWMATDLCGNTSTAIQQIQFIDTLGPIFYTPFDITIQCGDSPLDLDHLGEVDVYTDNCAPIETIEVTWEDDFSLLENCESNPVLHRIWTLTDPCGNSSSSTQRITINGYSMSQIDFPDDIHIPCDSDMNDLNITGNVFIPENACGYLIDTVYKEDLVEINKYQYERKWVCIDMCGHIVEQTQVIYLDDFVAPTVMVQDVSISFAGGPIVTIGIEDVMLEVEDNCDSELNLELSQNTFYCEDFLNEPIQVVDFYVTDDQGNVTIESFNVVLEGGLFTIECPANVSGQLEDGECSMPITYIIAPVGLCGQEPIVEQIDGTGLTSGDNFPIGITPQMYQITDQLGYTMVCGFMVEVLEAPVTNALACNDTLNVSVESNCLAIITADMLLEGNGYGCYDDYVLEFSDPTIPFVNNTLEAYPYIGQYLEICVTDPETGNFCCSHLLIEDKLPPSLTCSDITLECTDDISPEAIPHFPVPDEATVTPLGNRRYAVTGIDNCGTTEIRYSDTEEVYMCEGDFIRIITRTWIAADESGHGDTCTETISLERGSIEDFIFPSDTTIYCGNACIRSDGTPDPDCLGGIEGPYCGQFFKGYLDKIIAYCGGSYTVKREWSLVDWCTNTVIDSVQIINIEDNQPPVIDCESLMALPSDFGDCGGDLEVYPPDAYDACGSTPLTYTLKLNGQIILPQNGHFILPFLNLGEHDITWEVRDDCGNLATCETTIDFYDSTPPVAYCDKHTVIAINNHDPMGVALLPALTLDDGSFDNCGPVTFRARRMTSCINFDWTTDGHNHTPDGIVNGHDTGLGYGEYVPVSCCDVGAGFLLVELEVTDQRGNRNFCMVEVEVQDKQNPRITCVPDITVSCDFWFDPDILEHPEDRTFGTVIDGFTYSQSERQQIIINDPGNPNLPQPYNWGLDGYVTDNCNVELEIRVSVIDDCSGEDLPSGGPAGAVKLIQRRFIATDPAGRVSTCTQRIWVVDFDPFYINSENPQDPTDDVIWPSDYEVDHCGIPDTIWPTILNDNCAQIGINLKEEVFEKIENVCLKILRHWTVIDWCQYDSETGEGLWKYTQVVKVSSSAHTYFPDCPDTIQRFCTFDKEVMEIGTGNGEPNCGVHLNLTKEVEDICSETIRYDVKIYGPNSQSAVIAVGQTYIGKNANGNFTLEMNTKTAADAILRQNGLQYNNPNFPNEHYKIIWSVLDGCGNLSTCEEKIRLEDCKKPSPVCINGLSTVPMPLTGTITLWAKDFDASSFDNCTPENQLRYSFSGEVYQPSKTFTCEDIMASGIQQSIQIWVLDNWGNSDYCTTTIFFTDPHDACGFGSGGLSGILSTPSASEPIANAGVKLMHAGSEFGQFTTTQNGQFLFPVVPAGQEFTLEVVRNDEHKNGVNTLDILALQKHLLQVQPFNDPYQFIAGDANASESLTAVDMVEIRRLVLGLTDVFPKSKSWVFIPTNFHFIDIYNPWPFDQNVNFVMTPSGMVEDFKGVKVGDVNRSAKANLQQILPRSENFSTLYLTDSEVIPGQEVDVKVQIDKASWMAGQWQLNLNGLEVISITSNNTSISEDMWFVHNDQIRWSWNTQSPVEEETLFTIRLKSFQAGSLHNMISLDESFMNAELYTQSEETFSLNLEWREDEENTVTDVQLFANQPNPWYDETIIPFEVPESGDATLVITDATGREIHRIDQTVVAGKQQFTLRNSSWAPGVYYYTLRFGDTQLTKTMLILEKR